jgi:single stranded DNA-binding protein
MNVITVSGNLAKDPVVRKVNTKNGESDVCNFTIADNFSKKTERGNWDKRCTFWECTLWGKQTAYMDGRAKGDWICVVGRATEDTYEHRGEQRTKREIAVIEIMGPPRKMGSEDERVAAQFEREGMAVAGVRGKDIPF